MILGISIFDIISLFLAIVPISIAFLFFKTLTRPVRVLGLLLAISLVTDLTTFYLNVRQINNVGFMNVYTIFELGFYAFFYSLILENYSHKKAILIGLVLVFLVTVGLTFNADLNLQMNDVTLAIESLTIIATSLIYFDVMLKKMDYAKVWDNPFFWINSAILFYFAGSFFVFIFSNYLDASIEFNLWTIHTIVRIIFISVLTIGIWKARKI